MCGGDGDVAGDDRRGDLLGCLGIAFFVANDDAGGVADDLPVVDECAGDLKHISVFVLQGRTFVNREGAHGHVSVQFHVVVYFHVHVFAIGRNHAVFPCRGVVPGAAGDGDIDVLVRACVREHGRVCERAFSGQREKVASSQFLVAVIGIGCKVEVLTVQVPGHAENGGTSG